MVDTATPLRYWVPSIFIDDICPKPRARPEDWIATHPNGAKWLFSDDATEQPSVRIDIGDVVRFNWVIDHGTFDVTVHPNGSWTYAKPLPEGANGFMEPFDSDTYTETMDEFAKNAVDAWSISEGETGPVRVYTWSDELYFKLFVDTDGKLVFARACVAGSLRLSNKSWQEETFQQEVGRWTRECFGPVIAGDLLERGDRLLEEVIELLQSGDYPRERIAALEDYVYNRPKGEPAQEVGGVMVTLAAYCEAHGLNLCAAAYAEISRVWGKITKIRAKQAAKPTGSALPIAQSAKEA